MQWESDASADTFEQEVLERSRSMPVIVDFWAPWCAPCRVLGPTLQAAVEARGGQVWLVKVDVEQHQSLGRRYGVSGIPAVKAFVDGRPVDEFVGLLDRRAVEAFLDRVAPSPEDRALGEARRQGELTASELEAVLAPALEHPHRRDEALLVLAEHHLGAGDLDGAEQALRQIAPESLLGERAALERTRVDLLRAGRAAPTGEDSSPEARWSRAGALLAAGNERDALEELLELLQRDRRFREGGARRAMLAILADETADPELAREFRRRMQIYL